MELKELVNLYRHWLWLLIICFVLGLGSGYVVSKLQTPIYEASAKVLITRSHQQGGSDILSLSDQQLVLTYQQLLKTRPLIKEAGSKLGITIDPDSIKVDVILNTQIIQIKVQDESPQQAAAIAHTLIQILIEQNEVLQSGQYTIYEESLNSQIAQVQNQIANLQGQINKINETNITEQLDLVNQQMTELQTDIANLEKDLASFPNSLNATDRVNLAEKQSQLTQLRSLLQLYQQIQTNLTFIGQPVQGSAGRDDPHITSLRATLNLYQELYLDLLNNLETVKLARLQSTPTVTEIEEAAIPEKPIRPIPILYVSLSGIVGIMIASGAILLIDYFDDTLKSSQKIQDLLGIPVIGEIIEAGHAHRNNGGINLIKQIDPSLSNAFGSLRINVNRFLAQKSLKTILVTSPSLGEGKTTIASNLAATFAHSGKRVVLLDADLHHPQLHLLFGLDNHVGLNEILVTHLDWEKACHDQSGITVITSGTVSGSSSQLLESNGMNQLLKNLQKSADIVIVDGPPLFIVDSQILASKVGGVILIVRQGSTVTAAARAMLKQLHFMEVDVLGIVINRVPRTETYYFDGYYHGLPDKRVFDKKNKIESSKN